MSKTRAYATVRGRGLIAGTSLFCLAISLSACALPWQSQEEGNTTQTQNAEYASDDEKDSSAGNTISSQGGSTTVITDGDSDAGEAEAEADTEPEVAGGTLVPAEEVPAVSSLPASRSAMEVQTAVSLHIDEICNGVVPSSVELIGEGLSASNGGMWASYVVKMGDGTENGILVNVPYEGDILVDDEELLPAGNSRYSTALHQYVFIPSERHNDVPVPGYDFEVPVNVAPSPVDVMAEPEAGVGE